MQVISLQHPISVMGLPSKPLSRLIVCQGFFPKPLKALLLHKAVVLVLVHPGCFISPVPTISGEPSPHPLLGWRLMGDQQLHMSDMRIVEKYVYKTVHEILLSQKLQNILIVWNLKLCMTNI